MYGHHVYETIVFDGPDMDLMENQFTLVSLPHVIGYLSDNNIPNDRNDKVPFIRRRGEVAHDGMRPCAIYFFSAFLIFL